MKATGTIRRIDDLGRIVIPKEIRRQASVREGSPMEIYLEEDKSIILKPYSPIGSFSDRIIRIVKEMARMSHLKLSLYDCYNKLTVDGFSHEDVEKWENFYNPTAYKNGIVIPIILDNETIGYIFSENTERIDSLLMIARYICAEFSE